MRNFLIKFRRDESGLAAEFMLVLPLLILFVLGTFEAGMYAWRINQVEKATQFGARFAAVTNPVASNLTSQSLVNATIGSVLVEQGDRIPALDFSIVCDDTNCSCTGTDCSYTGTATYNSTAFGNIADRMRLIDPMIQNSHVEVEYASAGLGYAGDPNGPDLVTIITVTVSGLPFNGPILSAFGIDFSLPDFTYSLTAEDASGTVSN